MLELTRFLAEGFALGLATSNVCLLTCGPVYLPFLMQRSNAPLRYLFAVLELSFGRFISYMLVGALAGVLGHKVSELQRDYFAIAAYLLFSSFLIITTLRSKRCEGACTSVSRWSRFSEWPVLLGILTGINFCPSFLLAFSRSFELSGPVAGMLFFAAFFVGTSILLLPLSFFGMLGRKWEFRLLGRVAAIAVAVWFICMAGFTIYRLVRF